MSKAFQTVAVLGVYSDPRVADPMTLLAEHLTKAAIEVVSLPNAAGPLNLPDWQPGMPRLPGYPH